MRGSRLLGLGALVAVAFVVYVGFGGAVWLGPAEVVSQILRGDVDGGGPANAIVWRVRLPRACACLLVGAILGAVGAAFQALFRNPLADPYIVGVSSGAAAGGTLAVLLGLEAGLGLMAWSVVGGVGALLLVLALARREGGSSVVGLLIAGVVVGALLSGVTTLNLYLAGEDTGRVLRWLLGSTTPMFWDRVALLAVVLAAASAVLWGRSRELNVFALGEFSAGRLGVDGRSLRGWVLGAGTVATAVAVGAVGVVGFLGLVAPHIARRLVGPDLRVGLPASTLVGAGLLLAADLVAQRLSPGTELPLGAVTAVLGAPVLLWLLRRESMRGASIG